MEIVFGVYYYMKMEIVFGVYYYLIPYINVIRWFNGFSRCGG